MRCLALFYERKFPKPREELPVVMGLFGPLLRDAASCPSGRRGPLAASMARDSRAAIASSLLAAPFDSTIFRVFLVECRCARNLSLATPFRFFESANVYSTSDTKKIYKIELVYGKNIMIMLLSEGKEALNSFMDSHLKEFLSIVKILVEKYLAADETHKRKADSYEIHDEDGNAIGSAFEIKAGNSYLKLETKVAVPGKSKCEGPDFLNQTLSAKLSLCDVMLIKGAQELTRQKKEEELRRQNFIKNGGLL